MFKVRTSYLQYNGWSMGMLLLCVHHKVVIKAFCLGSLLTYCALVLGAGTPCACWHFLSSRWMMNLVWRNIRRAFSFTKRLVVSPSVFFLLQENHHLHVFGASSAQLLSSYICMVLYNLKKILIFYACYGK